MGTALLLATVVGSGIMAERLSGGNVAVALLANTIATGAGLVALILTSSALALTSIPPSRFTDASQGGLSCLGASLCGGPMHARASDCLPT